MKQNGFIATSLLYSFFLAFVTIFIAMITIYLQNRVYLNKLEDSSKNSIYIREMKDIIEDGDDTTKAWLSISGNPKVEVVSATENTFKDTSNNSYNLAKCEIIYFDGSNYIAEGCTS